jgi:hypothetical protein
MIVLDSYLHELGEIETDIDIEYGTSEDSTNDFEVTDAQMQNVAAGGFYIPGTEIGGLFDYVKINSDSDFRVYKGFTWRGLLKNSIIMPDAGEDYKIVSGDANVVISNMLSGLFGGIFSVSAEDSGLTLSNYQFPLYINLLDGIEGMLEKNDYRLKITASKVASHRPIQILLEAVPAVQVSGTYNEDNGIAMSYVIDNMGINHLICGGSGELQNRMIRHLYIDNNGNISSTQYYFGLDERTAFYDYPNAESEDDLLEYGMQQLKELASSKSLTMQAPEQFNLEIGDKVRGVFPDGTEIISPIVSKIYKISNGTMNIELKIKGEN